MVKRANSYQRDCELESYTCHNKNAIGEERNGKQTHKIQFPRENSEPISSFCCARNRVCNAVNVPLYIFILYISDKFIVFLFLNRGLVGQHMA